LSSLPEDDSFCQFLETSLVTMRRECPFAYQRLCELLSPHKVMVVVDAEEMTLTFEPRQIILQPLPESGADVVMRTTRRIVLDLTEGKFTLQQAVMDGLISIHGDLKDLILFHEGWLTYMRGAVHCPSIPEQLERFRYTSSTNGHAK